MNGSIALKLNDCIVNLSEIFVCSIMAKEHEEVDIYLAILYALFRKDNLSLAMEMFQKWTYLESSSCQCNLGKCWEIKKEENLAKDFYDKAAEQNNPIAMFGLFKFLHKPNSYLTIKELGLLQKSASCNYKMALLQLSQEYFNGNIRGNENNLLVATVISNYTERLYSKYGVDISGIDDSYHFDGIEKFVLINSYSNRSY